MGLDKLRSERRQAYMRGRCKPYWHLANNRNWSLGTFQKLAAASTARLSYHGLSVTYLLVQTRKICRTGWSLIPMAFCRLQSLVVLGLSRVRSEPILSMGSKHAPALCYKGLSHNIQEFFSKHTLLWLHLNPRHTSKVWSIARPCRWAVARSLAKKVCEPLLDILSSKSEETSSLLVLFDQLNTFCKIISLLLIPNRQSF